MHGDTLSICVYYDLCANNINSTETIYEKWDIRQQRNSEIEKCLLKLFPFFFSLV